MCLPRQVEVDIMVLVFGMEEIFLRTIFVIGAGRGLGNGVAEKFGREGFKVVLVSRNKKNLAEYSEDFTAKNISVETQVADVTRFEEFAQIFGSLIEKHGTPEVLFYNVGITTLDDKAKLNAQTLVEHYVADVAGAYNCVKLIDTKEFAEKRGAILITGGGLSLQPYADYLPLSMDKAALRAMVLALTPVLNAKGIYIGTVQVTGAIGSNEHFAPKIIAEKFWELYSSRRTNEIVY